MSERVEKHARVCVRVLTRLWMLDACFHGDKFNEQLDLVTAMARLSQTAHVNMTDLKLK